MERKTTPAHVDRKVIKTIRKFVAENGGSIRAVLEHGAIWVMSAGAKDYLKKIKNP